MATKTRNKASHRRAKHVAAQVEQPIINAPIEAPVEVEELSVAEAPIEVDTSDEPNVTFAGELELPPMWKRTVSARPRDETGRVIRRGRNLSGNRPWHFKFYYMPSLDAERVKKLARQARLIAEYMAEHHNTPETCEIGRVIVDGLKAEGLETPIKSAVLFAYYRRALEGVGLMQA